MLQNSGALRRQQLEIVEKMTDSSTGDTFILALDYLFNILKYNAVSNHNIKVFSLRKRKTI